MNHKDILAMASAYSNVAEASAKQRALANVKAQPKDKVSLAKAPWEKKKDTKKEEAEIEEALDAVNKKAVKKDFADRKDKDIDNDGDTDSSDEYLHKRRKAVSKAMKGKEVEVEVQTNEEVELDENKAIIKIYQDMKTQGKKDHNILDYIGSMPKYKRISRDQMAKIIGDAKRKGIFKEEVEHLEELTAEEKRLMAKMYDKKGNLTPLGKRVMDHGKAASKLTPKDASADTARRKEYNAYQKSKRNEEVDLDEAPRRKGAPKMTGDSIAIQRAKDAEHNKAMGRTRTGRKKPERTMTSTQKSLASMRRECAGELEEASASVYKDMPKAPGKMVSNRVQVKAFKDTNAMGAFLGKQNDNSWQQTGVAGLKSGKYKIDMVKKGGKPSKNFIKVNEEVELDEGFSPKQIEQLKKAYASMPDRVPMDMAKKMSAVLKGRSKEELIAIARADIKWLSTTAATNLIMQGVKAKEING